MNKLHRNRRYDEACIDYHRRKFRRRWRIALANVARKGGEL